MAKSDVDRWLEGQYNAEPGLEARVEAIIEEMRLVEQITALRKARGLSQRDLAARVGVTQPVIAKIESGTTKNLELRTLARIAAGLRLRVKVVLEQIEKKQAAKPRRARKRAAA
jgi:transcriptional regulator with XRE-family HTH domain